MLLSSSPAKGGIALLLTALLIIIQWNQPLIACLVGLIYISGLLILLLFLTRLLRKLKYNPRLNWIILIFILPLRMISTNRSRNFNITILIKQPWILRTIIIFLFLFIRLIIISNMINKTMHLRQLWGLSFIWALNFWFEEAFTGNPQ